MTALIWPNILVEALVRSDCVLFLGAGFTKNAISPGGVSPLSWTELLTELLDQVEPKGSTGRRSRAGMDIAGQIKSRDLLWAAQSLETRYSDAGRRADFRAIIATAVDGPTGAHFTPGAAHEALVSLNARTIVTTNYDKVLERLFGDGYSYLTFKSDNVSESIRTGKSVVLKLHGTTDDPQSMVLTRLDFAQLRKNGSQALAVLEALTLTRTVLFLGYSLDDPDLHLVLENQMRTSGSTPGHYLLTHRAGVSDSRRNVFGEAFGVEVIRYDGDYTAGFLSALRDLAEQVESVRVGGAVV